MVADARDRLAAVVDGGVDRGRLADVLCLEPDHAFDLAYSWLHLRDLHYAGPHLDALLEAALPTYRRPGAELLPSQDLERRWLRGVWTGDFGGLDDAALGRGSALARQVDVLNAGRGRARGVHPVRPLRLRRRRREPGHAITLVEAEAVLSLALDADDLALTASALWLWPLYGLPVARVGRRSRCGCSRPSTSRTASCPVRGTTRRSATTSTADRGARPAHQRPRHPGVRDPVGAAVTAPGRGRPGGRRPCRPRAGAGGVGAPLGDDVRRSAAAGARTRSRRLILTLAIRRARDVGDVPGVGSALEAALALERDGLPRGAASRGASAPRGGPGRRRSADAPEGAMTSMPVRRAVGLSQCTTGVCTGPRSPAGTRGVDGPAGRPVGDGGARPRRRPGCLGRPGRALPAAGLRDDRPWRPAWRDAEDVNQTVWLRLVEHLADDPGAAGAAGLDRHHHPPRVPARPPQAEPAGAGRPAGQLAARTASRRPGDRRRPAARRTPPGAPGRPARSCRPTGVRSCSLLLEDPPVPYREVSERLGIPMGSIGPTRVRALAQLRNSVAFRAFLARTDGRKR